MLRGFTIALIASLISSVATATAWVATLHFTFEDPSMPSPGLYLIASKPWLGWLTLALLAVAVVLLIMSRHLAKTREKRVKRGLCVRCGYDLTGNTSGVCPECGTTMPTKLEGVA